MNERAATERSGNEKGRPTVQVTTATVERVMPLPGNYHEGREMRRSWCATCERCKHALILSETQ